MLTVDNSTADADHGMGGGGERNEGTKLVVVFKSLSYPH